MKLSTELKKKYEFGDILAIHKATGISRPTIAKAFKKGGTATRKTIRAISLYYENLV